MKKKDELLQALNTEIKLRKEEISPEIQTVYFGGGTPSLLSGQEIEVILDTIRSNFQLLEEAEITLEANPDDLNSTYLPDLKQAGVNRLSIGIQSFIDRDLKLMNRAHNAEEAERTLESALSVFNNISTDLIYGIPGSDHDDFQFNINKMLAYEVPHISAYALTVEPRTALAHFIKEGTIDEVDDDFAEEQFHQLRRSLLPNGFVNYELSNFGREGFFSKNNTAYWQGKSYLGIGPSAHSFDGNRRSWNVRNNSIYIKELSSGQLAVEREELTPVDRYNEYLMTGLRTMWGVSLKRIEKEFGLASRAYLMDQASTLIKEQLLYIEDDILRVTEKGLFLSDGIASQLFKLNLK